MAALPEGGAWNRERSRLRFGFMRSAQASQNLKYTQMPVPNDLFPFVNIYLEPPATQLPTGYNQRLLVRPDYGYAGIAGLGQQPTPPNPPGWLRTIHGFLLPGAQEKKT